MRKLVSRRTFLGGSAVAGAGILLAACGTAAPAAMEEAPAAPEKKEAAAPKMEEATEIKYLHFSTQSDVWDNAYDGMFAAFEEMHPGLKLKVDIAAGSFPTSLTEKAVAAFASGVPYDVYYGWFGYLSQFYTAEMLVPLDPFLAADPDVNLDDFHEYALERIGGQAYGIAWFTNGKEYWYNADLIAEAGLKSPRELEAEGNWTWDAVLEMATKLTKTEGNRITRFGTQPYRFNRTGWFWIHLFAWGGAWWNDDFSAPTIDTQQAAEAAQDALDMVIKHRVAYGLTLGKEPNVEPDFTQQTVAGVITGSYFTRTIKARIETQEEPFKVEHTLLPKGPAGRMAAQSINAKWISSSATEPDAGWEFYKFAIGEDAIPFIAQLGGSRYAANKSIPPFTQYEYEDPEVYAQTAAMSVAHRQMVRQSELDKQWAEGWISLEEGKTTIQELLEETQKVAEVHLEEGGCVC